MTLLKFLIFYNDQGRCRTSIRLPIFFYRFQEFINTWDPSEHCLQLVGLERPRAENNGRGGHGYTAGYTSLNKCLHYLKIPFRGIPTSFKINPKTV